MSLRALSQREADRCSSTSLCVFLCASYQRTSRAAVSILAGADPGMDASPTLSAALCPGAPRGPEDWLRTGHPFITEPVEMAAGKEQGFKRTDWNRNTDVAMALDLRLGLASDLNHKNDGSRLDLQLTCLRLDLWLESKKLKCFKRQVLIRSISTEQ